MEANGRVPAAGLLPAHANRAHGTRARAAVHARRVPARRHDCRPGGTQRMQRLLHRRGDRLRARPTADFRTGPVRADPKGTRLSSERGRVRGGAIAALAERNPGNLCFLEVATNSERAQLLISELAPSV